MPNSKKFVPGQIMTKDGDGIRITGVLIAQDNENEINDNVRPTFELMKVEKEKNFVFPENRRFDFIYSSDSICHMPSEDIVHSFKMIKKSDAWK